MKYRIKDVIIFLLIILMICSCNTNNKNNADEIKKEKEKTDIINNSDIPDGVKDWEIKLHDGETITVLCISTSNRCNKIKEDIESNKRDIYYIELDNINEQEKEYYKNKFELKDYTGYLPYVIYSNNNKLTKTKTNVTNIDDILE